MDFEIDLDSECVWLGDAWFNRDDLVRKIRAMIDAGDFQIALPSNALEELTKALASARLLALRMTPEMSDTINSVAQQMGRPIGALVREAVATYLSSLSSASPQPLVQQAEVAASPSSEMVANANGVDVAAHNQSDIHAPTIVLKRKEEREEVEKRWFDK